MAQRVKAFGTKSGHLSSVLGTDMADGENQLPTVDLWPPHVPRPLLVNNYFRKLT